MNFVIDKVINRGLFGKKKMLNVTCFENIIFIMLNK